MKYLRATVRPRGVEIHPVHTLMTERDCVRRVRMLDWNLRDTATPSILFYVEGDAATFEERLAGVPEIVEYDLTPIADDSFYLHTRGETTDVETELYRSFTRDGLLVMPPLEYGPDGGVTFTVVGDSEPLSRAIEDTPPEIDVAIERVGEYDTGYEPVAAALTDRQLEAVVAGLELGYYEVPRRATHDDVADELDCAPSTASEHLRKAESRIVSTVFGE